MKEADKRTKDTEMILEVFKAMMLEKDLDRLLNLIATEGSEILSAERSSLFLVDYDTKELWSRVAQKAEITEIRFPLDKGIAGYVVHNRTIVNIKDAYNDPRFNPDIDKKTGYRTRTILCTPMINHKDEVMGAIQILNKKEGVFNEYDESLVTAFAAQAAVAIENTQLYQELESTFKRFLKTLASTLDARDPVTAGHSERVARYALNLGRAIGLNENELKLLDYAATLHDIGKIAVRDDILLKPGRFTPEEFEKMKYHAVKTREILENMFISRDLREIPHIAATHHEKLDGSGYPSGLQNNQLSKTDRILAIADVFDALVAEDRPYKKAMAIDQALAILEEGDGTKFDAELVRVFKEQKLYTIERRKNMRIPIRLSIAYITISEDKKTEKKPAWEGESIDISIQGMSFLNQRLIATSTVINITLFFPDEPINLQGKVVRAEKRFQPGEYLIGIQFINLDDATRTQIDHQLQRLLPA